MRASGGCPSGSSGRGCWSTPNRRSVIADFPIPSNETCAPAGLGIGSTLCTHCGLCCTGALHDQAVLDPDEVEAAAALGLPVGMDKRPIFTLPCPRLEGTVCSIYGERPRVCGRYKCRLLQDVEAGAVALDDAIAKVRVAKQLARDVEALVAPGTTPPQARRVAVRKVPEAMEPADRDRLMRVKLAGTVLNLYLDRHFRNDHDGQIFPMGDVSPTKGDDDVTPENDGR